MLDRKDVLLSDVDLFDCEKTVGQGLFREVEAQPDATWILCGVDQGVEDRLVTEIS